MTISKITALCALFTLLSIFTFAQSPITATPGGRLTLTSNTPVMTGDVSGATTIYYSPYVSNQIPLYSTSTSNFQPHGFLQLALTLNSTNALAGNVYDIWVFLTSSGSVVMGISCTPWQTSNSRGSTNPGVTQTFGTEAPGIWVSSGTFCALNGTTEYDNNNGTYVGSVYITADGETSMQFKPTPAAGGTGNVLGVYNAYNRVRTIARCKDSTSTAWVYSTPSWEALNDSSSNSISFLDGLAQSFVAAKAQINMLASAGTIVGNLGLDLDSTTASPGGDVGSTSNTEGEIGLGILAFDNFMPQLGFHFISAVQWASGSTVHYIPSGGVTEQLTVELDM